MKEARVLLMNKIIPALMLVLLLGANSAWAVEDVDPWENWNRKVFYFNEAVDSYVAKPVAKGYKAVVPTFIRRGVGNFFSNLGEVPTAANDLLQAKPGAAATSAGRFLINSTVGLLGLIDVASMLDIEEHSEDFGQTLAVWGVESGPYLVLPILGPSNIRDGLSLYPDYLLDPLNHADLKEDERYGITALKLIHIRHQLLDSEGIIQGDKYSFIRDVYLQSRTYQINDGQVEDKFDAGFDDLDLDDEAL